MSDVRLLTTPVAILIAGGVIAVGVYFGLRERSATTSSGSTVNAATTSAATGTPAARGPMAGNERRDRATDAQQLRDDGATAATDPAEGAIREQVKNDATGALEMHRASLVARCWRSLAAESPGPASSKLTLNFTFDTRGQQLTRGVSEHRETLRPGLAACVSRELPAIAVRPPPQDTFVEVPLTLP